MVSAATHANMRAPGVTVFGALCEGGQGKGWLMLLPAHAGVQRDHARARVKDAGASGIAAP